MALIFYPQIRESLSPEFGVPAARILNSLSFSQLAVLLQCDNATQRAFYELECMKGNWSVRELRRQIASLYYERSGLSKNKRRLSAMTQTDAERVKPILSIRDPYIFEFLGLKSQEVMGESHLEDQPGASKERGYAALYRGTASGGCATGYANPLRKARVT